MFQRTPNFSVPAHNRPLDPSSSTRSRRATRSGGGWRVSRQRRAELASRALAQRSALEVTPEERERVRTSRAGSRAASAASCSRSTTSSLNAARTTRPPSSSASKIREIGQRPRGRREALPDDHPFGTKRLCSTPTTSPTYNRDNVTLVDIRDAADRADHRHAASGPTDGEYELDVIVFATGFDAMTGRAAGHRHPRARGRPLKEKWSSGPRTYLGVATAGFPNLFIITGPGSPSVLSNMLALDRAARRVDRGCHRPPARARARGDRGDA